MLRGGRLRPSPWEIGLNKFLFLRIKRDGEGQALMGGVGLRFIRSLVCFKDEFSDKG